MAETVNYGLYTNSDEATKFKEWREKVAGDTDSNMVKIDEALAGKQDKITGIAGQVVGFDSNGDAVAQAAPDSGVVSFKGRKGAVTPQSGDYTAAQVGARPSTWMPTASDVGAASAEHTHTAADIGAAASDHTHTASDVGAVPTTRKINKKTLSADVTLTASDVGAAASDHTHTAANVGAVPTTRKVNGKALISDVTLSATDVGAASSDHTHTASDIGAAASDHTHTAAAVGAVPTSRKVNNKALSTDISLTASDVGARPSTWTPTAADVGAVPTTRKVNGKALSVDISLTASDVGAATSGHTHTASDVGALPSTGGTLNGNLTIKGAGNYGTQINLGDGDFVHISEPVDDVMELKAKSIRFVTTQESSNPLPVNHGGTGVKTIDALKSALGISGSGIPSGVIVMWSGATTNIPSGWVLCNGSNGTPDLRDRFVIGAGNSYSVGAKGGEATHKLTINEMPSHTHNLPTSMDSNLNQSNLCFLTGVIDSPMDITCKSSGGNQAHNNLPPYYALCYIMKT